MNVTVNYEVANKIVDIIENNQFIEWHEFEREMDSIKDSQGIKLMIDFYKAFDYDTYLKVLYAALNNKDEDFGNDFLNTQHVFLKRIMEDRHRLKSKIQLIRSYDFSALEKRLAEKLPKNTELDIDIFFVLDGMNGGSIVGGSQMMINTMFWPSDEKNLKLIEGILLHEYHHLGLLKWFNQYDKDFNNYSDGTGMAKNLMLSLLSEGAATYFYNDGDDLYPLIKESHGEEMATQYRDSILSRSMNIEDDVKTLERDLFSMINASKEYELLKDIRTNYSVSSSTEPLDKSIGYHMCSTIDGVLGTEALIRCFENPVSFFETYNTAVVDKINLKFTDDFISKWTLLMS